MGKINNVYEMLVGRTSKKETTCET